MSIKYLVFAIILFSLALVAINIPNKGNFNNVITNNPVPNDAVPSMPQEEIKEPEIVYVHTMEEALSKAKELNRKILIFFHASWCHNCTAMMNYFPDKNVTKALSRYVIFLVDTDIDKKTTKKYTVRGIPMYIQLDLDEKIIKKGTGQISAEHFIKWLE